MTASPSSFYQQAEERIERLTLLLGVLGAAVVAGLFSVPAGVGVATGAALAWVNSRWLRQGLDSLRDAAVGQHRPEHPESSRGQVPALVALRLIGRYALMALVVYVMFKFFGIPVLAVLAGLCALGAAAIVEGAYEAVARPG
jgi:hypothetical protein